MLDIANRDFKTAFKNILKDMMSEKMGISEQKWKL